MIGLLGSKWWSSQVPATRDQLRPSLDAITSIRHIAGVTPRALSPTSAVREVMTSPVMTLDFTSIMGEARRAMLDNRGSALPVVDAHQRPLGILTNSDLVNASSDDVPATVMMTTQVRTCSPDTPVSGAAGQMRLNRTHHLVVVEDNAAIGIVSAYDLLEVLEALGSD